MKPPYGRSALIHLQTYGGTPIDRKTKNGLSFKKKTKKIKTKSTKQYCPTCRKYYLGSTDLHHNSEQHKAARFKKLGYWWL
jgi:hypothetical protein